MYRKLLSIVTVALVINVAQSQTNRKAICDKLVKLGVTFVNSKEMQNLASCMEKTMIDCTPYDGTQKTNDKIYNTFLGCVATNLLTKSASASNILNSFTSCLKPSNASCLGNKIMKPFLKAVNEPYQKIVAQVVKCKANRAGEKDMAAQCSDKAYAIALAYLTKDYCDKTCITLLPKVNQGEFKCIKEATTKVMNTSKFTCQNKSDKCQAGTVPTCPAPSA
ncbi:hypothetical protein WR25_09543 [Diploscapter pachys]|uniref:DUF19 domain-containing protein n=1 Tax=Diploscapter pachys TaxID=2018661 RepID=A0A2A2KX10_9BILA|nr:hypothetical protein WR25_09543 [Diploscapter pachys]